MKEDSSQTFIEDVSIARVSDVKKALVQENVVRYIDIVVPRM